MGEAERVRSAARILAEASHVRLVVGPGAHGLLAGAILARSLARTGSPFHLSHRGYGGRDDGTLRLDAPGCFVFCGPPPAAATVEALDAPVVVVTHAATTPEKEPDAILQAGTSDGDADRESLGALAFLVASEAGPVEATDASLVAAAVDAHLPPGAEPRGLDAMVLARLCEAGLLLRSGNPPFASDEPVATALASAAPPFIRGVTGRAREAGRFLASLRVDPTRRFRDLTPDERARAVNGVVLRILEAGSSPDGAAAAATGPFVAPRDPLGAAAPDLALAARHLDAAGAAGAFIHVALAAEDPEGTVARAAAAARTALIAALVRVEKGATGPVDGGIVEPLARWAWSYLPRPADGLRFEAPPTADGVVVARQPPRSPPEGAWAIAPGLHMEPTRREVAP